jgi:hypothetical protein
MAKKTKAAKFRELRSVILKLLNSYTQEGVIEILKKEHDLDLTLNTFNSYLSRYSDNQTIEVNNDIVDISIKSEIITNTIEDKSSENSSILEKTKLKDDAPYIPPTIEELDAAMEEMKKRQELKKHRLL